MFARDCWDVWKAYTPTFSAGTGTIGNGTTAGFWRRVGDSIEVLAELVVGSTTTFQAGSIIILTYPPGITRDATKLLSLTSRVPGDAYMFDSSAPANSLWGVPFSGGNSNNIGVIAETVTPTGITGTSPFTWAAGDRLMISAVTPVTGW